MVLHRGFLAELLPARAWRFLVLLRMGLGVVNGCNFSVMPSLIRGGTHVDDSSELLRKPLNVAPQVEPLLACPGPLVSLCLGIQT